jgi:hypothetical protein
MSPTTVPGTTFAVADVVPATTPLEEVPYAKAVIPFIDGPFEACSNEVGTLLRSAVTPPLITALLAGFSSHRPIALSPDIIWLTICQGFAIHINQHAETLRHRLMKHEGKITLTVQRDSFIKGSRDNSWLDVFGEFSSAIESHVGDVHDLIVAGFSTTGPVERAASEVVLLDIMQKFFEYKVLTICE